MGYHFGCGDGKSFLSFFSDSGLLLPLQPTNEEIYMMVKFRVQNELYIERGKFLSQNEKT